MRTLISLVVGFSPVVSLLAQPALQEPPEFPNVLPGRSAVHSGSTCFLLASGTIVPGDVDWLQVSIPWASTQTVVDVDFPVGAGSSAMYAAVVGGSGGSNIGDNNNSRDAFCGLSGTTSPPGSLTDSAVNLAATPTNAVVNIGVTGAQDTAFNGQHSQSFSYDVWVYIVPVMCQSDADCNDNVACTVNTCNTGNGICTYAPNDAACDDGNYCDGPEYCHAVLGCRPGQEPDCDDGVECTEDYCDDELEGCVHEPFDDVCNDDSLCNGFEVCDPEDGCQPGTPVDCDDGVECTLDTCDDEWQDCLHTPMDKACDNGSYCDGEEQCHALKGCQSGTPPNCDDDVECTVDSCDDQAGACDHAPDDSVCDNGLFCDGDESCDAAEGCLVNDPPCPNGETCHEAEQSCEGGVVRLDIRPGQCPNRLNPRGTGTFAAAVLGSAAFEVRQVRPASLRLSRTDGVGGQIAPDSSLLGARHMSEDVATPYLDGACGCHELAGDGFNDLRMRFSVEDVVKKLRLRGMHGVVELQVTGRLRDGTDFVAKDCVVLP